MNSWKEGLPLWRRVFLAFESPMEEHINPVDSSLEEVKRNLDPAFDYVVFEEPLDLPNSVLRKDALALLSKTEKGVLEHRFYRDEIGGKFYLVVKLVPGETNIISKKFLSMTLPKETIFYVYGRRSSSSS